ncbi:hypothetical protein C8R44DRAFT_751829 [Mycena epipterygia]|nr:hypothetical protein C8R44DRAFT_751829 [Mycena epipterygia]
MSQQAGRRTPGIAQPRPGRPYVGSRLSPDSESATQQAASTESTASFQRQESSAYNATRRDEEAEQRLDLNEHSYNFCTTRVRSRRPTLADCQLDFELSTLTVTINPWSSNDEFDSTTVNLDDYVGNIGGVLVWGGEVVEFSQSCSSIELQGTLLIAMCSLDERGSLNDAVRSSLDLNDHIAYISSRRCFEAVDPDPALTELMSSANWMNFALITHPDLRGFLNSPAFQIAVKGVAQRAVDEVMSQMKKEMQEAVEKAVAKVSTEAAEFIESEMDTLTKRATNAAAYSGLGQLTIMSLEQKRAYDRFAPHISAATFPEGTEQRWAPFPEERERRPYVSTISSREALVPKLGHNVCPTSSTITTGGTELEGVSPAEKRRPKKVYGQGLQKVIW